MLPLVLLNRSTFERSRTKDVPSISNVNLTENQMLKAGNTSIKPKMKQRLQKYTKKKL